MNKASGQTTQLAFRSEMNAQVEGQSNTLVVYVKTANNATNLACEYEYI